MTSKSATQTQSHWKCKPTVFTTPVHNFVIKYWQVEWYIIQCWMLFFLQAEKDCTVTGKHLEYWSCFFFFFLPEFDRMSSNTSVSAGGLCGAHQGAEEWRGASGLQNKRWHYCPAQGRAHQEPYSSHSECNTHRRTHKHGHAVISRKLTQLFIALPARELSFLSGLVENVGAPTVQRVLEPFLNERGLACPLWMSWHIQWMALRVSGLRRLVA